MDNLNKLYLIDFGLCKKIIFENKHNQIKATSGIIVSKNYMSINSHNHIELSRRDDLESIGYMLLYLYNGTLDWNNESNEIKILNMKQNVLNYDNIHQIII